MDLIRSNSFVVGTTDAILGHASSFRQTLEARHAIGDLMEILLVDGVDRHLRATKQAGVVERTDFQNDGRHGRWPRDQMRAAFCTEFPRHGFLEIAACKSLGRSLGIAEAIR